jgi:aminoglycoside phosphotransferase (APT) family kinase protein
VTEEAPPDEALHWVAACVGATRIVSVKPLGTGVSSSVHGVAVERGGRRERLVLRRFTHAPRVTAEPDVADREADALRALAGRDGVRVPVLRGVDGDGSAAGGVPAVLSTRLSGRPVRTPSAALGVDGWLRGLARALPPIHALTVDLRPYRPYYRDDDVGPPGWSRRPRMWEKAIEVWRGPVPDEPCHLVHRDFHPGNVLWARGRVTGVVDWVEAAWGSAGVDLGHCRVNLALDFDVGVAERFLDAWRTAAGRPHYDHDPYWDLAAAVGMVPDGVDPRVRQRLEAFVGAAVAQL